MKIAVIYGASHKGSTWSSVQLILKELSAYKENELTEYYLPKDMPHFCQGCFTCFLKGEGNCPHAKSVQPIADALLEADCIVLASPVYGLDVTGGMKALIDHLCYMWISHRPAPAMFHKVGIVVTTTAGAGLSHTAKTMRNSLRFWGIKRVFTLKKAIYALKWDEVSEKNKRKVGKKAEGIAQSAVRALKRIEKAQPPLLIRFMFYMLRGMMRKNGWNETDRAYWEKQGWLSDKNPF